MNWIPYFFFILSGILIIRRFSLIKSSWKRNRNFVLRIFVISFIGLFSYFVTIELATPRSFYFMIPILFYSFFFFSYFLERRRLLNGMLFNLFILSTLLYIVFLFLKTDNQVILYLLTFLITLFSFILTFGIYFLISFLVWNSRVVRRKESKSLGNSLTLLLAISLGVGIALYSYFYLMLPLWLASLVFALLFILLYYLVIFSNFFAISLIYQLNNPQYDQDYIVVLGSGLINGYKVSKLLSNRIDIAIDFYNFQIKNGGKIPMIIMSGGQGLNEQIPEAEAMKRYAIDKGIPREHILTESNSKNTYENMLFSKQIMDNKSGVDKYKSIFSTNNFHLFRASLFAKNVNLDANGIGAKTARYFLPNAFLREFIAILLMKKKQHVIISSIIVVFMTIVSVFSYLWF